MNRFLKQTTGFLTQTKINSSATHQLFYRWFQPENTSPKATLLILHGMQEHSGRYEEFAQYLAQHGISVLVYDHLGHGNTAQNKEDLGFFQENDSQQQLIEDALTLSAFLKKSQPDVPHFLLGHSMGSFIARCVLQQKSTAFQGAIIVGTGGKIAGIGIAKAFLGLCACLAPKSKNRFVNALFANMNNLHFRAEDDPRSWLSVDLDNREAFSADPLNGVAFTNNGFYTLVSLNKQATKRNWAGSIAKDFPMLFVSGEDDPIGDYGKGVRATVRHLQDDGFSKITCQLYPTMRHEILNETIKKEVFADILGWIDQNLEK